MLMKFFSLAPLGETVYGSDKQDKLNNLYKQATEKSRDSIKIEKHYAHAKLYLWMLRGGPSFRQSWLRCRWTSGGRTLAHCFTHEYMTYISRTRSGAYCRFVSFTDPEQPGEFSLETRRVSSGYSGRSASSVTTQARPGGCNWPDRLPLWRSMATPHLLRLSPPLLLWTANCQRDDSAIRIEVEGQAWGNSGRTRFSQKTVCWGSGAG